MAPRPEASGTMMGPALITILVICIGAVIYLRRFGYMRRNTARAMLALLVLVLVVFGITTYRGG